MTSPLAPFVRRLEVRSRLTEAERAALLALSGTIEPVAAGAPIIDKGENVDEACLIVEGLAGRFAQARDGTRQMTAVYLPGDMPDLHSLVLPRAASALIAMIGSTIVRIPHRELVSLLAIAPGLAEVFWRDCMVDASIAEEWILNLGRHDARARMAHLYCEMAARYALIGRIQGNEFRFPVTQTYLAEVTGLTPIHVNRVLRGLREEGLLDVRGAQVTIGDRAALAKVGEFDPAYLMIDLIPRRLADAMAGGSGS